MGYTLEQFCADCHDHLSADPGPGGRERVRGDLERLLKEKDFVQKYCGPSAERGVHVLFEDEDLGFQVLAHINAEARKSPPHDHGRSWAIYGQAIGHTDMTEYERVDDASDPARGEVRVEKTYRLTPGHAGVYADGKIHSIDYPDGARFVRVTGTNLDKIERIAFDTKSGTVKRMGAQMAS